MAATTSLEHIKLQKSKHSGSVKFNSILSYSLVSRFSLYCHNCMFLFAKIVMAEKLKNATNVPNTPKSKMGEILAKKSPLCILNPDAKTIGGRQKKKKALSSNWRRSMICWLPFWYSMKEMNMPIIKYWSKYMKCDFKLTHYYCETSFMPKLDMMFFNIYRTCRLLYRVRISFWIFQRNRRHFWYFRISFSISIETVDIYKMFV